ncbi:MAG TPA: hypothetical protein VME20_12095 [Acidimicrobiales bacterium]|nr:hypothetical protein [Acidimicrobiales bacterium]
MPWCDDCSRFWNPPELPKGGLCPTCGRVLPAGDALHKQENLRKQEVSAIDDGDPRTELPGAGGQAALTRTKGAPWHFKLLVVGVTVYMVYRIYWLIEWLPKHI